MVKNSIGTTVTIAIKDISGVVVEVQTHVSQGLPGFSIVGLPDVSISESKDRVRSAIYSCGFSWPSRRITVNLSPASVPKQGSSFDLSIALSILSACGFVEKAGFERSCFFAELGLDGRLHPVKGILPAVIAAKRADMEKIFVATSDKEEAELIDGIEVVGCNHLLEVLSELGFDAGDEELARVSELPVVKREYKERKSDSAESDYADVTGQELAKYALQIAAVGGHHMLMVGPPGMGKTMLASRLVTIMPKLSVEDAIEVTSVHSICGTLSESKLIRTPPFEALHHTDSSVAIMGGGSGIAKPGAISRAHKGVLFLDEAAEFSSQTLQCLRQPLETKECVLSRAKGKSRYPADFQLILATNPCPCGMFYSSGDKCTCKPNNRRKYMLKLSGPLLDRVDIKIFVDGISVSNLTENKTGETSEQMKERVENAQNISKEYLKDTPWKKNCEVSGLWFRKRLAERNGGEDLRIIYDAFNKGKLTLRGVDRVIKLAFSIANLNGDYEPDKDCLAFAMSLRARDYENGL